MNEEIRQLLMNIQIQKMMVKSGLESFRKISELDGKSYEKQINILLDKLNALEYLERELNKKK
jgi:ABC-type Na+ transport system ATPase subunit NatA